MKVILIIQSAIIAGILGLCIYLFSQVPKIGYIDLIKVHDEFNMKKDLEKKLDNVQQSRKLILDSLGIRLEMLSRTLQGMNQKAKEFETGVKEFELMRQDYMLKQKSFEENNDLTAKQYDDQIWKQLNQYIKDYGKENGYDYLLGADGLGSVMYGNETSDLTENILAYVNEKYKGN